MFRRISLLALLLFLAATAMMEAPADKPGENSFCRILPADSFLYLEVKDIGGTLQRKDSLAVVKFLADEEIKAFIDELEKAVAGKTGTNPSDYVNDFTEAVSLFGEGLKGEMCITMPPLPEGKPKGFAFLAHYDPAKIGNVKDAIEDLALLFSGGEDIGLTFDAKDVNGIQATVAGAADKPVKIVYAVVKDTLVFTTSEDLFTTYAGYLTKPPEKTLADNPDFLKIYEQAAARDLFWYYDNLQLQKIMEPFLQMAEQMGAVTPLGGLLEISRKYSRLARGMGCGMSFEGDDVLENIYSTVNPEADKDALEFVRKWGSLSCSMKTAKFIPKDAIFYMASAAPFDSIYAMLEGLLPDEFKDKLMEIENQLMLSIKDDVIPAFGQEMGMYFTMQFIAPSFLVALEVKNNDTIQTLLTSLKQVVPSLTEEEIAGVKVLRLAVPNVGIQAGVALHDGFLIFGTVNALRFAITGKGENITANEGYQDILKMTKGVQKVSGIVYLDTKVVMGLLYDNFIRLAQAQLAQMEDFDPATIPSRDAFVDYMRPMGGYFTYESDVSHVAFKGMFPFLSLNAINPLIYGLGVIRMPQMPQDQPGGEDIF